jgi:hypothetical protein
MSRDAALFLFLAAASVAVFAFLSIAVWVSQRKTRDRFALLKALAEQPGDSAQRVLEMLREQEERQAMRMEQAEVRGYLVGGWASVASGIGLMALLAKSGFWTVGLLPLLVGIALVLTGSRVKPTKFGGDRPNRPEEK